MWCGDIGACNRAYTGNFYAVWEKQKVNQEEMVYFASCMSQFLYHCQQKAELNSV